MATTLFGFYKEKGQTLPSVTARAPLAAQHGITNYTGTAEQNTRLLAALQGGTGATPSGVGGETPAGVIPSLPPSGSLSNLRQALRFAAEEAGKERVASRLEQFQGAGLGRTPGTLGSIADIVRGSIKPRVEQTFSDIMKSYQEEQERLRLEGRAPEVIGSAETGYYQWDKDSRGWQRISNVAAAAGGFDSGLSDDSWVKLIMAGQANVTNVRNAAQQNRVAMLLANKLPDPTNEQWVKDGIEEDRSNEPGITDETLRQRLRKAGVSEEMIVKLLPEAPRKSIFGIFGFGVPTVEERREFSVTRGKEIALRTEISEREEATRQAASVQAKAKQIKTDQDELERVKSLLQRETITKEDSKFLSGLGKRGGGLLTGRINPLFTREIQRVLQRFGAGFTPNREEVQAALQSLE